MNSIKGVISHIVEKDMLRKVGVICGASEFTVLTLQLDAAFCAGAKVNLAFNDSEVVLCASDNASVSIANSIEGVVGNIARGEILSTVGLLTPSGPISALVLTDFLDKNGIAEGGSVRALVKATDIGLVEGK